MDAHNQPLTNAHADHDHDFGSLGDPHVPRHAAHRLVIDTSRDSGEKRKPPVPELVIPSDRIAPGNRGHVHANPKHAAVDYGGLRDEPEEEAEETDDKSSGAYFLFNCSSS
jgi:hypothetical protein